MSQCKYSALHIRLGVEQQRNLTRFKSRLSKDRTDVLFDSPMKRKLAKYVRKEVKFNSQLKFMSGLKNDRGERFCQSIKHYDQLIEQVERFGQKNPHNGVQSNPCYQKALNELRDYFSKFNLKLLSYGSDKDIERVLPRKDTHAGFYSIITGKTYKGDNLDGIFSEYSREEDRAMEEGNFNYPILPGVRTQGAAYNSDGSRRDVAKQKTRLISMIDMRQICFELKSASPFQEIFQHWDHYAGGKNTEQQLRRINTMKHSKHRWISIDYSYYDQSLPNWLIRDAFSVIQSAFKGSDPRYWEVLANSFIDKKFVLDQDLLVESHKGVPSGSMYTQIIDTIANQLMVATYMNHLIYVADKFDLTMRKMGVSLIPYQKELVYRSLKYDTFIMGDDNIIFTNHHVDIHDLASYLTMNFGVTIHPEKCITYEQQANPEFLSCEWREEGVWRDPNVLLERLLYPETFRNYASKEFSPEEIIYCYYLSYAEGMRRLIDINAFLRDHPKLQKSVLKKIRNLKNLPGAMYYQLVYVLGKSDNAGDRQDLPRSNIDSTFVERSKAIHSRRVAA